MPTISPDLKDGDFLRYNKDDDMVIGEPATEVGNVRIEFSGEPYKDQIMARGTLDNQVKPSGKTIADLLKQFMPFAVYAALSPMTTKSIPYAVTIDRPVTFVRLAMSIFVKASNNAENYWTIRLKTVAGIVIATCNTASLAPDAWHQAIITEFGLVGVNAAHRGLCIECIKTGDAGPLNLPAPLLEVL